MNEKPFWEKTDEDWAAESRAHPERYIPAGYFHSTGKRGPASYPSRLGIHLTLTAVCAILQVSKYQLGKLLGAKHDSYIYRWSSGRARPSAFYLLRALHLVTLYAGGMPVKQLSKIDWETGRAFWRSGGYSETNHFPPKEAREAVISENLGSKRSRKRARKELPEQRVRAFPIPDFSESI
jgi:hypothetical protein